MKPGTVILVGAGPGDPGLLTLNGRDALRRADVVVYDYLANDELLAAAPPGAETVYVGKQAERHTLPQAQINDLLLAKARAGKTVVRLKGGDGYVFGRGAEEALFLVQHGIPVEVIPGIPAAVGAAAYAGIPLTDRRYASGVTFITGSEDPQKPDSRLDWARLARETNTLVIYMGVKALPDIAAALLAHGMPGDTPVGIVERATLPQQRTVPATLASLAAVAQAQHVQAPALTIIGDVNRLYPQLAWFERRPLHGKRIVVTRSREQAGQLSGALRELGAAVLEMPVLAIQPPADGAALAAAVADIGRQDWVCFTSVNAVAAVFAALAQSGRDARALAGVRLAAIGSATAAALAAHGLRADFVPPVFTSEALFHALAAQENLRGQQVLLPRADLAPPQLAELLSGAGALVTNVVAYRTVPAGFDAERLRARLAAGAVEAVTFTSASTVRFFVAGLGAEFVAAHRTRFAAVSIGPVTSTALAAAGIPVAAEATPHDLAGLVAAVRHYLAPEAHP